MNLTIAKTDERPTYGMNKELPEPDYSRTGFFTPDERKRAFAAFKENGLPGRKNEEYKYSPSDLLFADYQAGINSFHSINTIDTPAVCEEACRLFIVNGRFNASLSDIYKLPEGVIICSAEENNKEFTFFKPTESPFQVTGTDAFVDLNTAYATGGLQIRATHKTKNFPVLQIIHFISGENKDLLFSCNTILVEEGAEITVLETYQVNRSNALYNQRLLMKVCPGASVRHYRMQNTCPEFSLIDTPEIAVYERAVYDTLTISFHTGWIRNNLHIVVAGQNADVRLNGLTFLGGKEHTDHHTRVDHTVANAVSSQLYKTILSGKSTGVFNGKIFVRKDAQKTNAYQSSRSILLSDDAQMNAKPQLEIYADDVKCSHGSSTGSLPDGPLFYLRARGLGKESARRLLLQAFAEDVLTGVHHLWFANLVREKIEKYLSSGV